MKYSKNIQKQRLLEIQKMRQKKSQAIQDILKKYAQAACKFCKEFNNYAESNQADGSFVCARCRSEKGLKTITPPTPPQNKQSFDQFLDNISMSKSSYNKTRESVPVGGGTYRLSIQGNQGAYCTPREDLDNLSDYEELEIAIFDANGDWATPYKTPALKNMPQELKDVFNSYDDVAGYVPKDKVEKILDYLISIS